MKNQYISVDVLDDVEEGVFDYQQYGNTVYRPNTIWKDIERDDCIMWYKQRDEKEVNTNIKIWKGASHEHRNTITGIFRKYWDCFSKAEARRPILNYEFAIDTGTAKPVCCRKPRYG